MNDLVERLKFWSCFGYGVDASATMSEAADEIERLTKALARIEAIGTPTSSAVDDREPLIR